MKPESAARLLRATLYALPLVFLILFYFYPLATILQIGLAPDGRLSLKALFEPFASERFLRVLWFTIWQAALSTLLTVLIALPGAYVMARYRFRGKSAVRALATLPFVLPAVVVAGAFTALLGPQGPLNAALINLLNLNGPPIRLEQTVWIILLAHVFYNYSVALRIISAHWQHLSPDQTAAAQMLGATPWRAFRHVTLPLLQPAILAAAVLVFIFCFTSFGVIIILGGPRFATLEVEIYRQAINLFNLPAAAALSLWQILFTFVFMWLYTRTQVRLARPLSLQASRLTQKPIGRRRERALVIGNVAFIIVFTGLPLLALVARSFAGRDGWTFAYYRELFVNRSDSIFFVPPVEAVVNSLAIALVATLLAVALGLLSANVLTRDERMASGQGSYRRGRLLDPLLMLPLATSAVTLGLGYLIAFGRSPLNLRNSIVLAPIAHTLIALPFVIRSILPRLRSIRPALRESASVLGASDWWVWRAVDWPLTRTALLVGAVFAFTISMGEFGATVFLARPQTPTMPIAIYRFLGRPGALNYGQAMAMSTLLLLVCAAGFLIIEHFRAGDEGEF